MKNQINYLFAAVIIFIPIVTFSQAKEEIFYEGFEPGWGNWWADNGVWEVGVPSTGPDNAFSGVNCAATVLSGDYPSYANTRLISQNITLPQISGNEKIYLKFWQYFLFNTGDCGEIQISVDYGDWQTLNSYEFDDQNPVWSPFVANISGFAGNTVRLGFYFESDYYWENAGWYIDEISIENGEFWFTSPESFENGSGLWFGDNGQWETGLPQTGPASSYNGQNCAATNLKGNYPAYANSSFISPDIMVPDADDNEKVLIKFWHWYQFNTGDYAVLQLHSSGQWNNLDNLLFDDQSPGWTQCIINVTDYQNSIINIGFLFFSDYYWENTGWYIDNITIESKEVSFSNFEGFEDGIEDWYADNGIWQVGYPENGPGSPHNGNFCAGTLMNSDYPSYGNSRLISPELTISSQPGQFPQLFFWHWYAFNTGDYGIVQVSTDNCYTWIDVTNQFNDNNPVWSKTGISLEQFAGQTIRIAFYFESDYYWEGAGWFIDDIELQGVVGTTTNMTDNEFRIYPNPFQQSATINLPKTERNNLTLEIYNLHGQLVFDSKIVNNGSFKLLKGNLKPGIYFTKLIGNRTYADKIIIK